jgi:hypothetical protein
MPEKPAQRSPERAVPLTLRVGLTNVEHKISVRTSSSSPWLQLLCLVLKSSSHCMHIHYIHFHLLSVYALSAWVSLATQLPLSASVSALLTTAARVTGIPRSTLRIFRSGTRSFFFLSFGLSRWDVSLICSDKF